MVLNTQRPLSDTIIWNNEGRNSTTASTTDCTHCGIQSHNLWKMCQNISQKTVSTQTRKNIIRTSSHQCRYVQGCFGLWYIHRGRSLSFFPFLGIDSKYCNMKISGSGTISGVEETDNIAHSHSTWWGRLQSSDASYKQPEGQSSLETGALVLFLWHRYNITLLTHIPFRTRCNTLTVGSHGFNSSNA